MPDQNLTLPLLPLTSGVVLPGMVFTMALESDEAKAAAEAAGTRAAGCCWCPSSRPLRLGGVVSEVIERASCPGPPGHGGARRSSGPPRHGRARGPDRPCGSRPRPWSRPEPTTAVSELAREYRAVLENILLSRGAGRVAAQLKEVTEPGRLADVAGYSPDLSLAQKVEVLETVDVEARLRLVLGWARDTLADLALRERIKTDVEEGMEHTQREFLLRRQLESIRKELGQLGEGDDDDPDDYRARASKRDLPAKVAEAVEREVGRLERTSDQSPESGWIRTWLDTVLELPWGVESEDRLDVAEAARILDEDHDGLGDVKERILEHLAVRKLQAERGLAPVDGRGAGAILALVGPPGVGKTSLGESVARALGRSFVRVALGGVRDEAEIRGHRRTYVGAQPGRLVRALREAGTMNPVIAARRGGQDGRGLPRRPVLCPVGGARPGPEPHLPGPLPRGRPGPVQGAVHGHGQRGRHHPRPLLDRMEVIRLDGYTEAEKVAIARHHLVAASWRGPRCATTRSTYRRGPRRRHRRLHPGGRRARRSSARSARLLRKVATKLAAGSAQAPVVVGRRPTCGAGWAGPGSSSRRPTGPRVPGVATGLAVTGAGGDVLFVEAAVMDGPEGLTLTGQLGDVMKESAEIALSYVRSHAGELGIDPGVVRGQAVPPARAGRRRPQGRALGRGDHDHGAGQPAARTSRCAPWSG